MPFVRLAISRLKPKQIRQRTFNVRYACRCGSQFNRLALELLVISLLNLFYSRIAPFYFELPCPPNGGRFSSGDLWRTQERLEAKLGQSSKHSPACQDGFCRFQSSI